MKKNNLLKKTIYIISILILLLQTLSACSSKKLNENNRNRIDLETTNVNMSEVSYLVQESLDSSEYPVLVEDVAIQYMSKEYYEELEFNSQENVYFGYTDKKLLEMFDTSEYSFTVNQLGTTVAELDPRPFDTKVFEKSIKNVAVGSGVIIVCASISVVLSGGATTPMAVMMVVGETASEAAIAAAISGVVTAGVSKINGKNNTEILEDSMLASSEAFKYSAFFSGASKILTSSKKFISTRSYTKGDVEITPENATKFGGTYGDLFKKLKNKLKSNGLEIHHIPANAASEETIMARKNGPAIVMTKEDHRKTASYGASAAAKQYRAKQAEYIKNKDWKKAFDMDVKDIRKKFGTKYNKAISLAEKAAKDNGLWN